MKKRDAPPRLRLAAPPAVAPLLFAACAGSPEAAPTPPPPPAPLPSPPWPGPPEDAAPPGWHWESIHHETIHARLLLPDGAKVDRTRDPYRYPQVLVDYAPGAPMLTLTFSATAAWLAAAGRTDPPRLGNTPLRRVARAEHNVTIALTDTNGVTKVAGSTRGVDCNAPLYQEGATEAEATAFRICSSLRPADPGPWRAATAEQRAYGSFAALPEGAWLEGGPTGTPGELLRPGPFVPRLHMGSLVLTRGDCPADLATLAESDLAREQVAVTHRGAAVVRTVTGEWEGAPYAGPARVWVPRAYDCCQALIPEGLAPPADALLDYAIALCEAKA